MENVMIFDHPLIQHKISILRNKNTGTNEFRALIEEIAMLMGYEALRDLPVEDVTVETPIETCETPMIAGRKLAVVPILRAGLGMVNGILALVPSVPSSSPIPCWLRAGPAWLPWISSRSTAVSGSSSCPSSLLPKA